MRQLHPNLVSFLEARNREIDSKIEQGLTLSPMVARESLAYLTLTQVSDDPFFPMPLDTDVDSTGYRVPIRIFHPEPDTALPVLIFSHGGGHMAGSVSVYEAICKRIAKATRHIVVAPEYRLAPENPYPAAIDDVYNVVKGLWPALDKRGIHYQRRLSMAGDSAGGALTASVNQRLQFESDVRIDNQILLYPSLDYTLGLPSVKRNSHGYLLESSTVRWYFDHYFRGAEDRYHASPLYGTVTAHLARTLVITAEFCPLCDEGLAYADRLELSGVRVARLHFPDMVHAFLNIESTVPEACDRLYQALGQFLNDNTFNEKPPANDS
uniref:alpha/beta hydrolase n=1 Tax=Thaumasiovibrio occultus TaxID=1891184 RepID=UPI000B359845|nr:alpha/beta hydrolase [Thaumasiovibrio occultus]